MAAPKPVVPRLGPRRARGAPEETRERIVRAAAEAFNDVGYDGTDTNRIARAAGYAPGTFYKHFVDKRAVFLAVYEEWVAREWRDVTSAIRESTGGATTALAKTIVSIFVEHHRRWRGFRRSLRALVPIDEAVRDFYRAQRRHQLELLAAMHPARAPASTREEDALLLFTLERTADALAEDEARALQLDTSRMRELLEGLVAARLAKSPVSG
jgi:AcrR family transcriptional regulator